MLRPHGVHPLMNEQERSELELLKQRQARLEQELGLLSSQLKLLDQRLTQPKPAQPQATPATPPLIRMPPPPIIAPSQPGGIPATAQVHGAGSIDQPQPTRLRVRPEESDFIKALCKSCGGHLEFPAASLGDTILCPHCGQSTLLALQQPM